MRGIKLVFIGGHFEFCEMEKILGMFSSLQNLSLHYITRLAFSRRSDSGVRCGISLRDLFAPSPRSERLEMRLLLGSVRIFREFFDCPHIYP